MVASLVEAAPGGDDSDDDEMPAPAPVPPDALLMPPAPPPPPPMGDAAEWPRLPDGVDAMIAGERRAAAETARAAGEGALPAEPQCAAPVARPRVRRARAESVCGTVSVVLCARRHSLLCRFVLVLSMCASPHESGPWCPGPM